jgi:hypothetical protein
MANFIGNVSITPFALADRTVTQLSAANGVDTRYVGVYNEHASSSVYIGFDTAAGLEDSTDISETATGNPYDWTDSGTTAGEYYVAIVTTLADPSLASPDIVEVDGVALTKGTLASLSNNEWDYGDQDTLGFNTVYIKLAAGAPTTEVIEHINVRGQMIELQAGQSWQNNVLEAFITPIQAFQLTGSTLTADSVKFLEGK